MIPKTIHYCWFGNKEKPTTVKKYIENWELYYPDFTIKEWNESNFNVNTMPFVKEAYQKEKYAFVSDVARIYALITEGGIYFDTDVLVLKKFPDELLSKPSFIGFEDDSKVGTVIIASEANHPFWVEFFNYYQKQHFILDNNILNMTPNVDILTNILIKRGLCCTNTHQIIEKIYIYPKDYFSPKSYLTGKIKKTINTYTIHDFAGTWLPQSPWYVRIEKKVWNSLGLSNKNIISKLIKMIK